MALNPSNSSNLEELALKGLSANVALRLWKFLLKKVTTTTTTNKFARVYEVDGVWSRRQVRKVICEWLAWILRMSRPGRSLSRRYLQRKARMRELTAKSPPSMSLISNVKDVDNAIPLNNYRFASSDGRPQRILQKEGGKN